MTSILDNKLVQYYFGDKVSNVELRPAFTAWLVLLAMQEDIMRGEKYIQIGGFGDVKEHESAGEIFGDFHPHYLRLPSRFQPTEKKDCIIQVHGKNCWHWDDESRNLGHWAEFCPSVPKPTPSEAVEEKIRTLRQASYATWQEREIALRELVEMVRGEK